MGKSKYQSIDEYIAEQNEPVQELLNRLREIIHNEIPNTTETFGYGVPAFTITDSTKLTDMIMIGGFKTHAGIYPQPETIEFFKDRLKNYKYSTGAIHLPINQEIDEKLIIDIINFLKENRT